MENNIPSSIGMFPCYFWKLHINASYTVLSTVTFFIIMWWSVLAVVMISGSMERWFVRLLMSKSLLYISMKSADGTVLVPLQEMIKRSSFSFRITSVGWSNHHDALYFFLWQVKQDCIGKKDGPKIVLSM